MDLLNIDLFMEVISYLNLDDVISLCQTNSTLHKYGINYNNNWKFITNKTYSKLYNYSKHLKYFVKITEKNNYLSYTKLINTFDPISQLMFYYRRGDYRKFDYRSNYLPHKYLALFLLGEKSKMKYYKSRSNFLFLENDTFDTNNINNLFQIMCDEGSIEGVKYAIERGALPKENCFSESCIKGYYDTVIFLVKNGADVNYLWDCPTRYSATNGHLKILKYLVEKCGGDIHAFGEEALRMACERGHLDVVKYLVKKGANIFINNNVCIINAFKYGNTNIVEYLIEQGVNPNVLNTIDKVKQENTQGYILNII